MWFRYGFSNISRQCKKRFLSLIFEPGEVKLNLRFILNELCKLSSHCQVYMSFPTFIRNVVGLKVYIFLYLYIFIYIYLYIFCKCLHFLANKICYWNKEVYYHCWFELIPLLSKNVNAAKIIFMKWMWSKSQL